MPYVITKINGKKFAMGHRGSESAVFTKEEVERVAVKDCVTAVNLGTHRTEKFGCASYRTGPGKGRKGAMKSWAVTARRRARGVGSCRCKRR